MRLAVVLSLVLAVAGCGGGGGGDVRGVDLATLPPTVEQCMANVSARLEFEPLVIGHTSEIHLLSCSGALTDPVWTYTGASSLTLITGRSQSLSVLPTVAGLHRFEVRYTDGAGRSRSESLQLHALPGDSAPRLLTRGDPSAWSGDRLSLRAWPQGYSEAELAGSTLRWTRVSGPDVSIAEPDSARLLITAPSVSADQLLVLRATLSWPDGRSNSDDFRLLVQPVPGLVDSPLFKGNNAATRTYPFALWGGRREELKRCVHNPALLASGANLCTLGELPLLGQQGPVPTINDVIARVLVSHDWQVHVFSDFLSEHDTSGDLRRMLAATTAIVIGGRIRPSFYWSATGAIYIDASYLWLTPEQRDTVSEAPDPRSAYGRELQYSSPWRYVKDNTYATPSRPVEARSTRGLDEIRFELGRLLYHELTHAGDFFPPASHAGLPLDRRVYEAVPAQTPSQRLQQQLPFFSQEMVGLGRVNFFGDAATATQRAYSPEDVARMFSLDRVSDDYAYSLPSGATVPREDAAMLVEEAMMQLRYGVLRDFGFTPIVPVDGYSSDQTLVWGQRGRIGEAALRARLQLVMSEVMPWVPASELSRLAPPLQLRPGLTWGQNLDQAALLASRPRALRADEREREREVARQLRLR